MALSNAAYLADDALAKGMFENFPRTIQIARAFPFMGVDGGSLDVTTSGTYTPGIGEGQVLTATAALTDAPANPNAKRNYVFNLIGTEYQISYFDQDRLTVPNNLDATLAPLAIQKLVYAYFKNLPVILDGATYLDSTNMKVTGAGAFTLADFYQAYFKIGDNNGRPNAIMSNESVLRSYLAACQAAGFLPQYTEVEWPDPIRGTVRAPMISVHGTPWYINNYMSTFSSKHRAYIMVLGDSGNPSGQGHGVTGIVPRARVGNMFVRRETPTGGQFISVDYTWPVGTSIGSQGALAVYDFTNL